MEFLCLFLIELCFMAIIGLIYTIPTIILVSLADWLKNRGKTNDNEKLV